MLAVNIVACNNDDLSGLNDYYESRIANESARIELGAQLTPDQVASSAAVVSDHDATAQFILDLNTNALSGDVMVSAGQNVLVQAVEIRRGHSGRNGPVIGSLQPDVPNGNRWLFPDGYTLSDSDVDLLLDGGVYVLVSTANHASGELRAQILLGGQYLLVHSLAAEQVVGPQVNTGARARSFLTVDFVTGSIQGSVRHSPDISPAAISMRTGLAGQTGDVVFQLEPDTEDPGVWNVPDNQLLSESLLQRMDLAELYLQATTTSYPQGELRAQLYLPQYIVRTVDMSGTNLVPPVSTTATGKAYVTINGVDGSVRAVVRIAGMTPANVTLARLNNSNNTGNRILLFNLEQQDDTWQLPEGAILDNSDFAAIGNDKLYFIATPLDAMQGEIAGIL